MPILDLEHSESVFGFVFIQDIPFVRGVVGQTVESAILITYVDFKASRLL